MYHLTFCLPAVNLKKSSEERNSGQAIPLSRGVDKVDGDATARGAAARAGDPLAGRGAHGERMHSASGRQRTDAAEADDVVSSVGVEGLRTIRRSVGLTASVPMASA